MTGIQEQYVDEALEEGVLIEDTFPMEEEAPSALAVPSNIDELIAQHMLNLFNRYRDTAIPGTIVLKIEASASSAAREVAVAFSSTLGPWDQQATFKSSSLQFAFERSVERYRDQTAHAVKALPAS